MMHYYLDASALVKRYINEAGSDWIRTLLTSSESSFFAAHIVIVEVISAFTRRAREGILTPSEYQELREVFQVDCNQDCDIIIAAGDIIEVANRLLEQHPLRALDALHLATALVVNQWLIANHLPILTFLCADERLLAAATAEGLAVDNPNSHNLSQDD